MAEPTTTTVVETQPDEGLMIPKRRFDEINAMYKESEAKLAEMAAKLKDFETKDARIAELEKELQDTKSGYEIERLTSKKKAAIEAAIKDKTVDPDVVSKLLDMEKISFNDKDEVIGLDEQVKALQTEKPYLWKVQKRVVAPSGGTGTKPEKSFARSLAEDKVKQLGIAAKSKNYFN